MYINICARAHPHTPTYTQAAEGAQVDQWVSRCSLDAMELAKGPERSLLFPLSFLTCCVIRNLSLSLNIFLFYQAQSLEAQPSSFSTGPKDLQEERKYVDDVQVNVEGSKDVFLWTHGIATIPHQELGIEGQEHCKYNCTQYSINGLKPWNIMERKHNSQYDPTKQQHHQHHKEHPLARRKVILGLEAKYGDGEANQSCNSQAEEDGLGVVVAGEHSCQVGHGQSKDAEEDQVPWEVSPWSRAAGKDQIGDKENSIGSPIPGWICLDISLNWFTKSEDSHNADCNKELKQKDAVNLPDEYPAYILVIPAESCEGLSFP